MNTKKKKLDLGSFLFTEKFEIISRYGSSTITGGIDNAPEEREDGLK